MPSERDVRSRESLLIESAARINGVLEHRLLLEEIRDLSCESLNAQACSILLENSSHSCWEFHLAQNELTDPGRTRPLSFGEGLAGWVGDRAEAVLVNDTTADPRLRSRVEREVPREFRSVMAVPLRRGTKVTGVLEVLGSRRPEGFTQEDLGLLEAFGNHASVALANAHLYEMVRREKRANELLYRVGLALARTLRLDELLPLLGDLLAEMIAFDALSIYLYHRGSGLLEWFHGRGYPAGSEDLVRLKVGQGAVGWVAAHKEALIIPDTSRDDRYQEARPQTCSEMAVPLMAEGELVGIFNLESDALYGFHNRDLRVLLAFGNQAAIAIQRAYLHNEAIEKRRMEEEIRIARRIQRRQLPVEEPDLPGLDIAAFNHPSREVSGDVYDFIPIAEDQLGILIGDVSGKGVAAGIMMAAFRASLRAEIRNNYAISVILSKVNRLLWESTEDTAFVTGVYGVLDLKRARLTYANAGHNPPLLMRRDGEVQWLDEGGLILGCIPEATYREAIVDLRGGDTLVFYTDGITEALSPDQEEFGQEGLLKLLRPIGTEVTARDTCLRLLEAVHTHAGSAQMSDDLTAIVLRIAQSGLKMGAEVADIGRGEDSLAGGAPM
jgi:serine phosphatase RsbU (regulator of sigma subunit)